MAVAMETLIQARGTSVTELQEFLVPKILSVNLKKKAEDRSMNFQAGGFDSPENGGDVNKTTKSPVKLIENEQKNLSRLSDDEIPSAVDLDIEEDPAEDEEDVIEMAPERHRDKGNQKQQSSYLLQPFLKPVAQNLGGSPAENPILKALFGGGNAAANSGNKQFYSWAPSDRPATNNCHPFKKTELSRDIVNDETPIQVPKSLSKDKDRQKSLSPRARSEPNSKSYSTNGVTKGTAPSIAANVVPTPDAAGPLSTDKGQALTKTKSSIGKNSQPLSPDDVLKQTLSKIQGKGRASSVSSLKRIGYVNSEKLMKLRTLVDNAIKNHKVYSMTGCYTSVRNALKQRGWIEKIDSDIKGKRKPNRFEEIGIYDAAFQFVQKYPTLAAMRYSVQSQSGFSHNDQINYSGQGEAEIINRMLKNINEDLCWLSRPYPYYSWKDIGKFDLVNRLPKAYFSNKIGLCNSLQHIQWYFQPGVCSTQYPRTYNMSQKDEYDAFRDDFRITACIGLLKWLTTNYRSGGEKAVRSVDGKVDACVVDFALKRCSEYVKYKEHEDIDLPDGPVVWEYQWDHFIAQYYKIINDGHLLKECKSDPSVQVYVTNALAMLNLIKPHWSQMNIDGYQNYWVVKPGGRCCGNGIVIKNNLEQILMLVNPTVSRETRYVVQKYIERPLLIYNTKFDIRQWFLVTSAYPLTVWMYRESYLRFCSQPFSLKNTHESIHLCNNAVQRRYKNSKRDRGLPDENMWDCYTFQTYLKSMGYPDAWEKYIYPGMKEGFIGALLASQDTMERRKNCFELYGADFMISDTLTDGPWLIEINSNPAMDSSTSVTARMCPQVLEDIVKVVIDRRDDKNASTGAFEMVFKQHCPPVPPYLGMSLSIKGQRMSRNIPGESKPSNKKSKSPNSSGKFLQSDSEDASWDDCNDLFESTYEALKNEIDPSKRRVGAKEKVVSPALSMELLDDLKKEILRAKISIRVMHNQENRKGAEKEAKGRQAATGTTEGDGKREKNLLTDFHVIGRKSPVHMMSSRIYQIANEAPGACAVHRQPVNEARVTEQKRVSQQWDKSEGNIFEKNDVRIRVDGPESGGAEAGKGADECNSSDTFEGAESAVQFDKEFLSFNQSNRDLPVISESVEALDESIDEDMSVCSFCTATPDDIDNSAVGGNPITDGKCSNLIKISPRQKREDVAIEEAHPFLYIKRLDVAPEKCRNRPPSGAGIENSISAVCSKGSDNEADRKMLVTDSHRSESTGTERSEADRAGVSARPQMAVTSDKYVIKQEMRKVHSWKRTAMKTNGYKFDSRRRWKLLNRKKVDWVRKNIDDVRVRQELPRDAHGMPKPLNVHRSRGPGPAPKSTSLPKFRVTKQNLFSDSDDYEDMYRDELLKIFFTIDCKKFIQQLVGGKGKFWRSYMQVKNANDKKDGQQQSGVARDESGIQVFSRDGETWKPGDVQLRNDDVEVANSDAPEAGREPIPAREEERKIRSLCGEMTTHLGLTPSESPLADGNAPATEEKSVVDPSPSSSKPRLLGPLRGSSCPVIQGRGNDSTGSGGEFGSDEVLARGKSEGSLRGNAGSEPAKCSEPPGADWKKNVETARRACNEILTKLREFNESNSKVRLQQALRKGKEIDNRLSDILGVCRTAKGLARASKGSGRKHLSRSQIQRDGGAGRSRKTSVHPTEGLTPSEGQGGGRNDRGKRKKKDGNYLDGFASPKSDSSLAINRENGAVRKVHQVLPKVEEWTFPFAERATCPLLRTSRFSDRILSKRE